MEVYRTPIAAVAAAVPLPARVACTSGSGIKGTTRIVMGWVRVTDVPFMFDKDGIEGGKREIGWTSRKRSESSLSLNLYIIALTFKVSHNFETSLSRPLT